MQFEDGPICLVSSETLKQMEPHHESRTCEREEAGEKERNGGGGGVSLSS